MNPTLREVVNLMLWGFMGDSCRHEWDGVENECAFVLCVWGFACNQVFVVPVQLDAFEVDLVMWRRPGSMWSVLKRCDLCRRLTEQQGICGE